MSDIQSQQIGVLKHALTSSSICVLLGEIALRSDALCASSLQSFLAQPSCLVQWRVSQIWHLGRCLKQRGFCDKIMHFCQVEMQSNQQSVVIKLIPVALLGWSETTMVSESKMEAIVVRWGWGSEVKGLLSCFFSSSELLSTTTVYNLTPGLP